jgi:hypothetical protein
MALHKTTDRVLDGYPDWAEICKAQTDDYDTLCGGKPEPYQFANILHLEPLGFGGWIVVAGVGFIAGAACAGIVIGAIRLVCWLWGAL